MFVLLQFIKPPSNQYPVDMFVIRVTNFYQVESIIILYRLQLPDLGIDRKTDIVL